MSILLMTFLLFLSSMALAANPETEYLDELVEQHVLVDVTLANGEKLQCYIKAFDDEIIIVESSGELLLYKHGIYAIASADGSFRAATE